MSGLSFSRIGRAATPRAFERWGRNIGMGRRINVQFTQLAKHFVFVLNILSGGHFHSLDIGVRLLEDKIQRLQIDPVATRDRLVRVRAALREYKGFFDNAPVGFHRINPEGIILEVNECWLNVLGYARNEVVGKPIFDFIVPEQRAEAHLRFTARLRERTLPPKPNDRLYVRKDGAIVPVLTNDTVFRDSHGKPIGIQTSFQDLSALRKAEQELRQATKQMLRLEHQAAIGQFTGALSHAYKNQIVQIAGFIHTFRNLTLRTRALSDVLAAANRVGREITEAEWQSLFVLNQELGSMLALAQETVEGMEKVTRNMVAFSRGGGEEREIISVRQVVERVCSGLQGIADQRGVELRVNLDSIEEQDGVYISPVAFGDIVRNLVTNAIEAHAESSAERKYVDVWVERISKDRLRFYVKDNGVGMEPSIMNALLKGPVQSVKPGGTGLGLSVVKRFLDDVTGSISMQSNVGEGTMMVVELPRTEYAPEETPPPAPEPIKMLSPEEASRITILLVDDEPASLMLLKIRIENMGFRFVQCQSGEEALERYRTMVEKPQVVITDYRMPRMQGTDLMDELAGLSDGDLPVLILHTGIASGDHSGDVARVTSEYGAVVVEKNGRPGEIEANLMRAISAKLAMGAGGEVPTKAQVDFQDNPYYMFARRVAAVLEREMRDGGDLRAGLAEFSRRATGFARFALQAEGLGQFQNLAETDLPEELQRDAVMQQIWGELPPDQRYKLAILCDLYMRGPAQELMEVIAGGIEEEGAPRRVLRLWQRMKGRNRAVALARDAEEQEAERFQYYYEYLAGL